MLTDTDTTAQATPTKARRRCTAPQPLHAAQLDDALLTLTTASAVSGVSQATLYRKAAEGELKLVKIGKRCTRIRSSDLRAFMASLG